MAITKKTGWSYKVCTQDGTNNYDQLSLWTDAKDVDTNIQDTTVSLDKQLSFVDMGTVPTNGGTLTKTYSSTNGLLTRSGFLDIYVDDNHSKAVPTSVVRNDTSLSLTFPASAAGASVKVRCWK